MIRLPITNELIDSFECEIPIYERGRRKSREHVRFSVAY